MIDKIKRLLFVIGLLWILTAWLVFSIYGVVHFWDRHVTAWFGNATADNIGYGLLVVTIFWIFYIVKTIVDETETVD